VFVLTFVSFNFGTAPSEKMGTFPPPSTAMHTYNDSERATPGLIIVVTHSDAALVDARVKLMFETVAPRATVMGVPVPIWSVPG
jgi:hypothetical protein